MRKFLAILLVLLTSISFGQSVVNRASQGNTVSDARLQAAMNFFIPRYTDTTAANLNLGIDSTGAIIFTYDVNNFWIRVGGPKHWQQGSGGGTVLPDGVYSGGQVAYSGTAYDYIVSAATYVLGGVLYNSPQTVVSLPTADPTFDRIDVIGLTFSGINGVAASVIGTASANPQEPSVNPQVFIRRSIVTVVANTVTPPNIDQTIIFDEGVGEPGEWTPSSSGTTIFTDPTTPYHLLVDALTNSINSTQRVMFVNDDTIQSAARSSLVLFINFQTALPTANNINVQLLFQGNPVSPLLPVTKYGVLNNINLFYQMAAIPFSEFATGNIIFDEIDIVPTGASPFPIFYLDYIQMQSGLAPIVQIPNQKFGDPQGDNFSTTTRSFNFNNTDFTFNNINKFVSRVAATSDSAFTITRLNGSPLLRVDGITNTTNVFQFDAANGVFTVDGAAARVRGDHFLQFNTGAYMETYQQPLRIIRPYPTIGPLSTHVNLALSNDTTNTFFDNDSSTYKPFQVNLRSFIDNIEREKFYINGAGNLWSAGVPHTATADTVFVWKNGFYQGMTITEFKALLAAGGTVTSIGFNTGTGITSTAVPLTSTGTIGIDTTVIATRLYAQSLLTTYYNSNVGSSYRWAIPNTNQIKTLRVLNGVLADSATSNTLSLEVDSTQYATKAWVASVTPGGGTTGVTSVSGVNTNGFSFSIANPTTTPAITLSSTVNGIVKSNGTALSAATAGTDYSDGTSALATGLLKSTTGTGALSIATANTDYITPSVTTLSSLTTAGSLVTVGNITSGGLGIGAVLRGVTMTLGSDASFDTYYRSAGGVLTRLANGTSGQFLGANTGAAPSWQSPTATITINSSPITSGTSGRILYQNYSNQVSQSANLFFDAANNRVQSRVFLNAGTATAGTAPLQFTSGTNLTTASAGAWEYDGTNFYVTPTGTTRKRLPIINNATPTAGQGIFGNGTDFTIGAYTRLNNSVVVTPSATGVTYRTNSVVQTLSGTSVTLNADNGWNGNWTLSAVGSSLAITNPVAGATYVFFVTQDATGSRTITTYPSGTIWYSGTAPTLKTTAGAVDVLRFYYNGSNYIGEIIGAGGTSGFTNPMTTLGDMIYGGASGTATRVIGNTTANPRTLIQTGTGVVSAAPSWQDTFTGLTASATLDFPNTGAQTSSELTLTVTGAAIGDVVDVGTAVNNANSLFSARVSAANTVSVKFNNFSAVAINPASGTFKVIVWR